MTGMRIKKNSKKNKTLYAGEGRRERIILSYSLSRYEELKTLKILQSEQGLKVNDHLKLRKSLLCKYLIQIGLRVLERKYGQVNEILKNENMVEE